jgi:ABC-type phosphate transport system permease subunit
VSVLVLLLVVVVVVLVVVVVVVVVVIEGLPIVKKSSWIKVKSETRVNCTKVTKKKSLRKQYGKQELSEKQLPLVRKNSLQ